MPTRGRPRKVEQKDEGVYISHEGTDALVPPDLQNRFYIHVSELAPSVNFLKRARHTVKNAYNDPLSFLWIIDTLEKASPNNRLRATHVANHLNQLDTGIRFDPNNVGRMLAEIADFAAEQYVDWERHVWPVQQFSDWRGRYYVLNRLPSTYRWLWNLRLRVEKMAREVQQREREGIDTRQIVLVTATITEPVEGEAPLIAEIDV